MNDRELLEYIAAQVGKLAQDVEKLKQGQKELREGQNGERLDTIEKIVMRIEHDHGQKLEALLEEDKQTAEKLKRIEEKILEEQEVVFRRI